mgnify:CR=1 FL=1
MLFLSGVTGGQYVFINIPGISWMEFHPFSLSSAPGENRVHLHVRVLGDWTRRLHTLASKVGQARARVPRCPGDGGALTLQWGTPGPHARVSAADPHQPPAPLPRRRRT